MDIEQHYSHHLDREALLNKLKARYPHGADHYQLAPIDQLHIGGIKASEKLVKRLLKINPEQILEIGSGMGGFMRLLHTHLPVTSITGIDITHDFSRLNRDLYALTTHPSPPSRYRILTGDAQQLPLTDSSVDCIVFQHSLLNIPDSLQCLKECRRVLKPDGMILLHEVVQGKNSDAMIYPVPWAREPEHSHLLTIEQLSELLETAGFSIDSRLNWSEEALAWRQRQTAKEKQRNKDSRHSETTISPVNILGKAFLIMGPNLVKNLQAGAVTVWEITAS